MLRDISRRMQAEDITPEPTGSVFAGPSAAFE
jgi:hypothetical protein